MICKEAVERTTDHRQDVSLACEERGPLEHLSTRSKCRTNSGNLQQLSTPAEKIPETRPFSANVKADLLAKSREQQAGNSRFMSRRQREIAAAVVRVAALVGIAWFVMMWKGIGAPAQKYQEYAVDFSTQPLLRTQTRLPSAPRAFIPCDRLDLTILLGAEEQPGPYEVVLVQDGMRYAFASGSVKLENRQRMLRVRLDLSRVPPGESRLGIRPAGQEGKYHKVMLE